jgi:galactokinase
MTTALITLICFLLCLAILYGGYYLAKHVVERNHRVKVLEDAYKEATDHIAVMEQELLNLSQQLEHAQYEVQISEQRGTPARAWNPKDMLNSSQSRQ